MPHHHAEAKGENGTGVEKVFLHSSWEHKIVRPFLEKLKIESDISLLDISKEMNSRACIPTCSESGRCQAVCSMPTSLAMHRLLPVLL